MKEKLKWNAIGLAKKTQILRDYPQSEKASIPADHTSKISKVSGYLNELNYLLERMEKIEKIIIPTDWKTDSSCYKCLEQSWISCTEKQCNKAIFSSL